MATPGPGTPFGRIHATRPHRLHLEGPEWDGATEVEVRFSPEDDGTRVDLEHRGRERVGARGRDQRNNYDGGWNRVLACFATHGEQG